MGHSLYDLHLSFCNIQTPTFLVIKEYLHKDLTRCQIEVLFIPALLCCKNYWRISFLFCCIIVLLLIFFFVNMSIFGHIAHMVLCMWGKKQIKCNSIKLALSFSSNNTIIFSLTYKSMVKSETGSLVHQHSSPSYMGGENNFKPQWTSQWVNEHLLVHQLLFTYEVKESFIRRI